MALRLLLLFITIFLHGCFASSSDNGGADHNGGNGSGGSADLPEPEFSEHLDYLVEFHNLAALVRFHHPSNGVHGTDWDAFLAEGSHEIATVESDTEFAETVESLIGGVAPMVQFGGDSGDMGIEGADDYRVNLQSGYVDKDLPEEQLAMSVFTREQSDVSHSDLSNSPFLPVDKVYTFQGDRLIVHVPLAIPLDEGEEILPGEPFNGSEQYDLPESLDHSMACLSSMATVWGVIRYYYPYFHDVSVDWSAKLPNMLSACEGGDPQIMLEGLQYALTPLEDNHLNLRVDGARHSLADYVAPVGLDEIEGEVVVTWLGEEAPDDLAVGDQLLSIDGEAVETRIQAFLPYSLRAPNRARNFVISQGLLRGDEGESLDIEIRNESGELQTLAVETTRAPGEVFMANRSALTESDLPQHVERDHGVHYVNVSMTSADEVEKTVEALADAEAVVLDLRLYPQDWMGWRGMLSHFSEEAIASGPMRLHYANWPEDEFRHVRLLEQTLAPASDFLDIPVVVLASRYSVSQNEHALAYVENAGLPILGEPTYGINGNVTQILTFGGPDEGGMSLRFTGMEVRQNDETPLIGRGIQPEIEQPLTIEGLREGRDVQLDRATDWLLEQVD